MGTRSQDYNQTSGGNTVLDITLLTLTKNEENKIQHMLQNVVSIAREIVIVDTGSTDKTVEKILAVAPNAKIHTHEFTYFSDLLNYGIGFCTSTWVLVLDADEMIKSDAEPLLKQLIEQTAVDAWEVPRKHWEDLEMTKWYQAVHWYPNYSPKLFKRGKILYRAPVHSVFTGYTNKGLVTNGFHIQHFNLVYNTPEIWNEKTALYAKLRDKEIEDIKKKQNEK